MKGEFMLITVYQAVTDDNEGKPTPSWAFFEHEQDAITYSKPGTWSGDGRAPIKHGAIQWRDGRVQLLSKDSVTVHATFEEHQEKLDALNKLTDREKRLLGLK